MSAQFQYLRLAHQTQAVESIADVFNDVHFAPAPHPQANPVYFPHLDDKTTKTIKTNIERIRAANGIEAGPVAVASTATPTLSLDILMETGTGKTFTFIETIHKLYQRHRIAKFIVLVPSNAIRQGTLQSLKSTAAFFAKEYKHQKINVINYSDKTVGGFIQAANQGISVMVATFQSFNRGQNTIHQRAVEANLFGQATSYMEGLAAIRPVLIMDEPHRFEGKQTQEYLSRFNPLLTIRFGATFKNREYCNLLYTLDSLQAFRQRLVKGITVDTVGTSTDASQTLCLQSVTGTAKERVAHVHVQYPSGKNATVLLHNKDNLGEITALDFLNGHIVETISTKELIFTNGFALPLGEPSAYGVLAHEVQSIIIQRSIVNHFEREEDLFKRGIKALSLFFIDSVAKYLPNGTQPAVVRDTFEHHYRSILAQTLARPELDLGYRAYLERSAQDIGRVHKGYFARSHSEKGEEDAIKLILQEKEKLLSFNTDLRFIFSMWALQEGWDNPNVFTLCKLAPSNSRITKLQQIGRGLRLAVNQQLQRVSPDDDEFDAINDLTVVVPASEGDFVAAIQSEIAAHSVNAVSKCFDDKVLVDCGVASSTRMAHRVLDALAELAVITLDDDSGQATLLLEKSVYQSRRTEILTALGNVKGLNANNIHNLIRYFDTHYEGAGQVKAKKDKIPTTITVNVSQFQHFKALWEQLNRNVVLHYELDTATLIYNALQRIAQSFDVKALSIDVARTTDVQSVQQVQSTQARYELRPHTIYTLAEFVRELANATKLSLHTIGQILQQMPADKFALIRYNEHRALATLRELLLHSIHELLVHKTSYELRELKIRTSLTDATGALLQNIPISLCGSEIHTIKHPGIAQRSLYAGPVMPVDSQIERDTVDESNQTQITVFAKLPKIDIPTPAGKYNPDFGYCIQSKGQAQTLYLVVETKGYDSALQIPEKERWKMESAKRFFHALQQNGVPVHYRAKINSHSLSQLLAEIDPSLQQLSSPSL